MVFGRTPARLPVRIISSKWYSINDFSEDGAIPAPPQPLPFVCDLYEDDIPEQQVGEAFDLLDTDGSGFIDFRELKLAMGSSISVS